MHLNGSRIVITGASEGIGRELTLQLAKERARLVLAARLRDKLFDVCDRCVKSGGEAFAVTPDVRIEADCSNLIEEAPDRAVGGYFREPR